MSDQGQLWEDTHVTSAVCGVIIACGESTIVQVFPATRRYTRLLSDYQHQLSPELNNSPIMFPPNSQLLLLVSFVSWHQSSKPGVSITQSKQLWNCRILIHQNMENWTPRRLPSTSMSRILLSFWMRRSITALIRWTKEARKEAGSCHGGCTQPTRGN